MESEERVVWDALRDWLTTDEEGRSILRQLGTSTSEVDHALTNWLNNHTTNSPDVLVNLVSGGKIEKLVNIARAGVVLVSQPKVEGPLLSLPKLALSERTRLNFAARRTELVGRESEIESLEQFLKDDRTFSWWLLVGPAGAGKSRLALDFCLQNADSWKTGFIPRGSTFADWNEWQPSKPILAVVDYAADRVNMLRPALRALSQRQEGEKIRFLLLERTEGDYWWKELVGYGTESYVLEESSYAPPLSVSPMSKQNIARIVEQIVDAKVLKSKDKDYLEELHNMEFLDRPLFAALAADAINNGRDPRQWDEERLIRDVLDREIHLRWIPSGITSGHMKALVLSTMASGLPASALLNNSFPDILPASAHTDLKVYRIATGGSPHELIEPLEPDVVGEFFALQQLGPESEFHHQAPSLVAAAWTTSAEDMASFISRASADFPNHVSTSMLLLDLPPDPVQQYYWVFPARLALERMLDRDNRELSINLCRRILESRFEHPAEKKMREYYKDAGYESFFNVPDGHAVAFTGPDAYSLALYLSDVRAALGYQLRRVILKLRQDGEVEIANELISAYLRFIESHPYDPQSVAGYVWTAFEHIHLTHAAGKTDESIDWYRHVSDITELRPDHQAIWDARQKGLVNLIYGLCEVKQLDDALQFFAELRQLWRERPKDKSIGERVREGGRFLSLTLYQSGRFADSLEVLEDIRSLMAVRKDLSILAAVGEVTGNLASQRAQSGDTEGAKEMLENLRALHAKGKTKQGDKAEVEKYLWTIHAVVAANLMSSMFQARILQGVANLYDELQRIDESGKASQPLSDFLANALIGWMITAYRCGSQRELERAYFTAREFATSNADDGPLVTAIGARFLATVLIREGLYDRAVSIVSEAPYENLEDLWTNLKQSMEAAEVSEVRKTLEQISS